MRKKKNGERFSFADEPMPIKQPQKPLPEQLLLNFLQKWRQPTITSKQLYQYAPRSIRSDRENAIKLAGILEQYGWLNRIPTRQRNWRQWQIVRKDPVIYPKVAG
jgi:hypothetical protein